MINTILNRMEADQTELCVGADLFLRYMLNGRKKKAYLGNTWRKGQLIIHYKNDLGKRATHIVNRVKFVEKVNQYLSKGKTNER